MNNPGYRRAITHCLGQTPDGEYKLSMVSGGVSVGRQRFHLLASDTAVEVTTYRERSVGNRADFQKLIACSEIKQLHWVNIYHQRVHVETIHRF